MNKPMPCVYLASPWKDRAKAKEIRDQFVEAGIRVNSRWLDSHHQDEEQVTVEELATEAMHDVEDVSTADILVVYNSQLSEGKAVEFGIALTMCKGIVLIGKPTNVFHHLMFPKVETVEEAIAIVKDYPWRPGQEPEMGPKVLANLGG